MGVDYNAPPVIKIHNIHDRNPKGENDYLLLIVRNYKECFPRHSLTGAGDVFEMLSNPNNIYYTGLRAYHEWPKEKKLLIYYEDFIQFPEQTLQQLADFFRVGHEYVTILLQDFELHKNNAIAIYERYAAKSMTRGEHIHFHEDRFSQQQRKKLDALCEAADPELFRTYLLRYKEPNVLTLI